MAIRLGSMNSLIISVVIILFVGSFRGMECQQKSETLKECYSPRALCVPVQLCPIMKGFMKSSTQYTLVKQEVWCRVCGNQRVYCEPEDIQSCQVSRYQKGQCVAKEQCNSRTRHRKCHQESGKDYYCCPEEKINFSPVLRLSEKRSDNVENAYATCSDGSDNPGVRVPVVQCNHLKDTKNRGPMGSFLTGGCRSNVQKDSSSCCTQDRSATSTWIPHPKAQRLGLDKCSPISLRNNIFGGSEVTLGSYPWFASLMYKTGYGGLETRCGGTLIHSRYILTAAHCVNPQPSRVYFENCDTFDGKSCQQLHYTVERSIPHKKYQISVHHNDIALLKLYEEVQQISPVCLPLKMHLVTLLPRNLIVVGRGRTDKSARSLELREAQVEVVACSLDKCYGEDSFCVRSHRDNGGGHCSGDSGGPFFQRVGVDDGSSKFVQFGVISAGQPHCGKDGGTEVSVGYHIQWILDRMDI